jgi:two-component system, chemotaxis family, sensor kinase CheA
MFEALENIKIVVVDDDPRNRFALASYLEGSGMEIHLLESGFQTIDFLEEHQADIILMDMMMPEMDGFETIQKIKSNEQTCDIPIIAVTAQAMKGDREKCLEAGASDYISKPINMKQLFQSIEKLVQKKAR